MTEKRPSGVRQSIADRIDRLLWRSPAQPLFRWRAERKLAVIAYHHVEDEERFALHLDYLRTRCSPVSLGDVVAAIEGGTGLPRRAVLVTFDDADRTLLERGLALLEERGIPAVAFVVAGYLDGDRPFWWREVDQLVRAGGSASGMGRLPPGDVVRSLKRLPESRRVAAVAELRSSATRAALPEPQLRRGDLPLLRSAGIEIGNHTMTHPSLPGCPDGQVHREVMAAHEVIAAATGSAPEVFAYPNGDWDRRAERLLEESYRAAFLFDHSLQQVPPRHPLRISRVRVDSTVNIDRLDVILSGLHPAVHRLRRRLSGGRVR